MRIAGQTKELRTIISEYRQAGLSVGFVPTMGNLHAGHLALVDAAQEECDKVVVSIFLNPMQFAPDEDFDTYPVTPAEDEKALIEHKTSLLYRPQRQDIFLSDLNKQTRVEVPELSGMLCGLSRPHFFSGVATVVNTLFNRVQPDIAYFGKKDYQQFLVIRKMIKDLAMNLEVVGIDTVRLDNGLAMSSRNKYLSSQEINQAAGLYRVLQHVVRICQDNFHTYNEIEGLGIRELKEIGFAIDYLSIRRQCDLKAPERTDQNLIVLAAVWLGKTRLIDNLEFSLSCSL
ncbi:MAG: pantoate--beta-alanine ligase [Gammaproteobacteria bacterium]|nr:MAG: pantoate--beta-alanine ligase [Gammaproteobacteria bacterium]